LRQGQPSHTHLGQPKILEGRHLTWPRRHDEAVDSARTRRGCAPHVPPPAQRFANRSERVTA